VPVTILTFCLAIITHDIHHPSQILRHGLHLNIPRPGRPRRRHGRPRHHRLLTNRTPIIESRQITKAMRVNGMPTGQILRTLAGGEHVLATHRTAVLVLVRHAIVRFVDGGGDAHAAFGAVAEVVPSADAAEAALVAVEGTFVEGHPDVAFGAVVLGEGDSAVCACIGLAGLAGVALLANNLLYRKPIHRTACHTHFIMTDATAKHSSTAWSDDVAFSFIMNACHHFYRCC